jgi:hypothetical protein
MWPEYVRGHMAQAGYTTAELKNKKLYRTGKKIVSEFLSRVDFMVSGRHKT